MNLIAGINLSFTCCLIDVAIDTMNRVLGWTTQDERSLDNTLIECESDWVGLFRLMAVWLWSHCLPT